MLRAFGQHLLLRGYQPPERGRGRTVFTVGKTLGIFARCVAVTFLGVVLVAAAVDSTTLLLSFIASYPVIGIAVAVEVFSALLMYLGNWFAARAAHRYEHEA